MATKFFTKELANNTFYMPDGKTPVNFEVFPSNVGVIALDTDKDAEIIAVLEDAASKRRGGIVPVSEAEYAEIKKNRGGSKPFVGFQPPPRLQAMRSPGQFRPPPQIPQPAANPAVANGHQTPAAVPAAQPPSSTPKLDAPVIPKRPKTSRKSEAEGKTKAPAESPPKTQ